MPNEAQLKAQMQAAIAAKKQASEASRSDAPTGASKPVEPESSKPPESPTPVHQSTESLPEEKTPVSDDRRPPVTDEPPITLTFFGQAIRFTTHQKDVYFAMDDILPLSNNHEAQNKYIEFKNQPATRTKAESLIKTLTFTGENGTEKLDGAKATHVIEILRELRLSSPGPLSRWLEEISIQYQPKDDNSAE